MEPTDRKPSSNARDFGRDTPIVYPTRPTKYEVVVPEELELWQRTVAESLGLKDPELVGRLGTAKTGTWSFSPIGGGHDTFDDSDEI
jgi:hypothetical protein